jgi:hypothetical protein
MDAGYERCTVEQTLVTGNERGTPQWLSMFTSHLQVDHCYNPLYEPSTRISLTMAFPFQ